MPANLPQKIVDQISKAGLPTSGEHVFRPSVVRSRRGYAVIEKRAIEAGPKKGKRGYVDEQGRIWIKDHAHADVPEHWDVQIAGGEEYMRVDAHGNEIS